MTTSYPHVRRLLGSLGSDWRTVRPDPLDYLADRLPDEEAAAVTAELGELCARADSEYDYVSVLVDCGARFSPYSEFGTAERFVRQLRDRLSGRADGQDTDQEPVRPAAGGNGAHRVRLPECPRLRQLLVLCYAKGCTTFGQVLADIDCRLGRLVDLGDVDPGAIAAELAELLEVGRSESDFASVTTGAGAMLTPDAQCPTTGDFLQALRQRLAAPGAGGPELATSPGPVIDGTLGGLKRGDLHAAMTGLARMYGVPELGTTNFPAFHARVGELLDQVLPQWIAGFVDDATQAAETVADDASWMRARWMRSAIELLLTAYADRAAAEFVDRIQVAQIDELLCAPTCRFGVPAGKSAPRFANSHWWWRPALVGGNAANCAGLPMHPRWYPGPGVWRVKVPAGDASRGEAPAAAELSTSMIDASLAAFGDRMRARNATVMVQVLDEEGSVVWADASMTAQVRNGALVVTDPDLADAPAGEHVLTTVTVRGTFGRAGHRAEWSIELMRESGEDGREHTTGGSAVFALTAAYDPAGVDLPTVSAADAAELAAALRTWEERLGAGMASWRSSSRPTLVSRYGWGCDALGGGPAPARPLLHGISAHLWAGELRLGLVGICRAFGAGLVGDVDLRTWREDWVAALSQAGPDTVGQLLGELVDETRRLDYPRWHLLCAIRSGIQFVGDELDDERLAGLFPVAAVGNFDDAMRSFGRRFGPVPREHVPGGVRGTLWERHPWWRYPVDRENANPLVELDALAESLWAELDRPERDRKTKASTKSLATVLKVVRAVCEGEVAGFSDRVATEVSEQVAQKWDLGAALTDDVLRYFQPIARGREWPLPMPRGLR
ncbi:MAG: hypothetical protein GEV07_29035 [Streptosporangiales bacterium]|nr:hypothetical protein [Streptosporangiales bacterium]